MLFEGNERKELERRMQAEGRLPPGQVATLKWPVLHYGSVPRFDPERWDFRIYGRVENRTPPAFGKRTATTYTAIPGRNSASTRIECTPALSY
ncbi:MAG: hypothetical protein ACRD2Y_02845 [Terriglobales bacterium]